MRTIGIADLGRPPGLSIGNNYTRIRGPYEYNGPIHNGELKTQMKTLKSKIRACFDYRGSNFSHIEEDELTGIVLVLPNVPWDIEWAQLIPMGKNFNLRLKWKGKETPFEWEDLSTSKVIKTLRGYRG